MCVVGQEGKESDGLCAAHLGAKISIAAAAVQVQNVLRESFNLHDCYLQCDIWNLVDSVLPFDVYAVQ